MLSVTQSTWLALEGTGINMKFVISLVVAYLIINVVILEQTIRELEKRALCTEVLEVNNRAWKRVIIDDHIEEIEK